MKLKQRPKWAVDYTLEGLIGAEVRVAARAFSPPQRPGDTSLRFSPVSDLFLPDNSQPAGLPVLFEGRLQHFERRIGVVFVWLDAPTLPDGAVEGAVLFRGKTAVILHGPAVVESAWPLQIERLPADSHNYWRDLRVPRAQLEFPFHAEQADEKRQTKPASQPPHSQPNSDRFSQRSEHRLAPVDLDSPSAVDRTIGPAATREESCGPPPGPNTARIRNLNCSPLTN